MKPDTTTPIHPISEGCCNTGMTYRQHLAALAMQSLIIRWNDSGQTFSEKVAEQPFEYADKIIEKDIQ